MPSIRPRRRSSNLRREEPDMRPFAFERADSAAGAVSAAARSFAQSPSAVGAAQFLAGGTTLIDLMKLDVMRPDTVIDINAIEPAALGRIEMGADGLRLGAL